MTQRSCYTNFTVSIYICGLIVLSVSGWMCQLYFIGCLELLVYRKVPSQSTALCCFSTVIHPLPCIYPPLRSQSMQQRHRPMTPAISSTVLRNAFFSPHDSHPVKCFLVTCFRLVVMLLWMPGWYVEIIQDIKDHEIMISNYIISSYLIDTAI